MIYTSYFAKIKKLPDNFHPISISRWTPKGVDIPGVINLAPTTEILSAYKKDGDKDKYVRDYTSKILDQLNIDEIMNELNHCYPNILNIVENENEHIVLCCYEKSGDFCHRYLISDYLNERGFHIEEFNENKKYNYDNKNNLKKENIMNSENIIHNEPIVENTITNRDILNRTHPEEIEQMLGYLLMDYWEKLKKYGNLDKIEHSPINIVDVYKDFLRQESLVDPTIYDRLYKTEIEKETNIIDGDYKEIIVNDEINLWKEANMEQIKNNESIANQTNDEGKTLCFTGRRPKDLFGYKDKVSYTKLMRYLYNILKPLVLEKGFTNFISGTAQGFDQLAFRVVHKLKKDYPDKNIKNIVYMPYRDQGNNWLAKGMFSQEELRTILKNADEVVYVNEEYTPYCLHQRNHAMVNKSDAVFGLFPDESWMKPEQKGGTTECLKYALNHNKEIYQLTYDNNDKLNTMALKHYDSIISNEPSSQTPTKDALFGVTKGLICQQVNCMGIMGAGLAKAILEQFPIVKERFDNNYNANMGFQFGTEEIIRINDDLAIVNIYSQEGYGNAAKTGIIYTDADKLITSIKRIAETHPNEDIYIPLGIGCGFGGEKWENIYPRIKALELENIYILDTKSRTSVMCMNPIPREKTPVNLLAYQAELATKYGYKLQPTEVALENFKLYYDNLPECFKTIEYDAINLLENKGYSLPAIDLPIISKDASLIADKYDRIVVGQYGAFIEIDDNDIHLENLKIKEGQEYRVNDEKYSKSVKYQWYTCCDNSDCKLYFQQHGVSYADYKSGKWYISPYEVQSREEQLELDSTIISSDNHGIDLD